MAKNGPLVILEDDPEDRELMLQAIEELDLKNEVRFFSNANDVLYFLMDTKENPFLIISDINLPAMDGLELRRKINDSHYLHRKSIPFVFLTTSSLQEHVIRAYDLMVQGYFIKPDRMEDLVLLLRHMIDYWKTCQHPNTTYNFINF
ncbi:MAG: response regulator [Sphingobacteriales bacterium]|nr:MAG: response regulator [Sphingobacteriales bacterium]